MAVTPEPPHTPLIVIAAVAAVAVVALLIAATPLIVKLLIAHFVGA